VPPKPTSLDTGDAIRYFGAIDGEVSPKEAVVERIAKLQKGYTSATGGSLSLMIMISRTRVHRMEFPIKM
jgi:hypothetical protein